MAAALVRGEVPDTDCSLCHEAYKEPKILPCGHVLCRPCLLSWLRAQPQPVCPICRCVVLETGRDKGSDSQGTTEDRPGSLEEEVGALPTDLALAELVEARALLDKDHTCCVCEDVAATALCLHCRDMLCATCAKAHRKMTISKHHKVEDLSSLTPNALAASRPSTCISHPDEVCRHFCPTHGMSVCVLCVAARHKSCTDLKDLEVSTEEARVALADMAASLSASEHTLREAIQQLDRHVQTTAEQVSAAVDYIQETCDRLESDITSCRVRMTDMVRKAGYVIQERAQAAVATLQGRKAKVKSHTIVVTRAEGSKAHVNEMSAVMGTRVHQLGCDLTLPARDALKTMAFSIDEAVVSTMEKALAELGRVNLTSAHHLAEASGGRERPDDNRDHECSLYRHGGDASTPKGSLSGEDVQTETTGPQRTGETQLVAACLRGSLAVVKSLVDKGQASLECRVDMTVDDEHYEDVTPLWAASSSGNGDIVKYLVRNGASVGGMPLVSACLHGHLEIVQHLLEKGADVNSVNHNSHNRTALMHACQNRHIDIVNVLLDHEASVNITDDIGWTALMFVCEHNHADIVNFLLDPGAAVIINNNDGSTDLTHAWIKRQADFVNALLDHGAGVNITNTDGLTALMYACEYDNVHIVNALLDNGADVNIAVLNEDDTKGGRVALHYNAMNGNVPILKLLLSHGATFSRDCNGETALLRAACERHDDYVGSCLSVPDISRSDKADALEVLGAMHWVEYKDKHKCPIQWQRAMEERHRTGKPVVLKKASPKVAVFGRATEVQTPAELQELEQSRDRHAMGMQAILVAERVLGKEHGETAYLIRVNADINASSGWYDRAMQLCLHGLDNLSAVNPFQKCPMLFYAKTVDIQVRLATARGNRLHFSDCRTFLRQVMSALTRAEAAQPDSEDRFITHRQRLLRIVLHAVSFLQQTMDQALPADRRDYLQDLTDLVSRNLRGQGGDTLLHMACDADTIVFSEEMDGFKGCSFPCIVVAKALKRAGCQVHTRNDAGKTALDIAGEQRGPHRELFTIELTNALS